VVIASIAQRTRELLDQVANSPATMAQLRAHAHRRLERARHSLPVDALNQLAADDLVQQALAETFIGTLARNRGRHPRRQHLANLRVFTDFLGSTINSLVSNQRVALAARMRRTELSLAAEVVCPAPSVQAQVDFRLRLAALITELRAEFAHRPVLLALLNAWERDGAHLDRLPGKPFNAYVVRQAARRILLRSPTCASENRPQTKVDEHIN